MKAKVLLGFGFIFILLVLVGLNAASVNQKPKKPDSELYPDRSTFNAGSTGTRALYTLLSETGRRVTRWQEPTAALGRAGGPHSLIVIGPLRREYTDDETAELMAWVSSGNRLIVVDRNVPEEFARTSTPWNIKPLPPSFAASFGVDPSDPSTYIKDTPATPPAQPSMLTAGVGSVQPSTMAGALELTRDETYVNTDPSQKALASPVVYLSSAHGDLLVESPYGSGKIIFLTDPFILSNAGLRLADNAQLAVNFVTAGDGSIAFDEYHQGFGSNENRLAQYFAGTPVVAIFLQACLLLTLLMYSNGRRFARALPSDDTNRLTKLEYVSAMAELQRRTHAYDLAIENIYRDFHRRASNLLGVDTRSVTRRELAALIAERLVEDAASVERTLKDAEDVMFGDKAARRDATRIAGELRRLEKSLGIARRTSQGAK